MLRIRVNLDGRVILSREYIRDRNITRDSFSVEVINGILNINIIIEYKTESLITIRYIMYSTGEWKKTTHRNTRK